MPTNFWGGRVLIVCMLMTASCVNSPPNLKGAPPRLILSEAATRPCAVAILPAQPTLADLEAAYMSRGAQIVACDGARRLAVDALLAERALQDDLRGRGSD